MPIIRVEMFDGRSREQKERFAKAVTDDFVSICGGTAQAVQVIFTDVARENWSTAGALATPAVPQKTAAKSD